MQTTKKTCFKCGVTKPLSEFYAHKQMADGHLNKCKCCAKRDVHEHRHGKGRERVLAYDLARAKTQARKVHASRVIGQWKTENPKRRAAQIKLGNAVRKGLVTPWPVCSHPLGCECTKVEAHHPDYDSPLDVVWLCPAHHKQAHALARKDLP